MKAVGRILRSYLHRRFFNLLLLLPALYCLVAAVALTREHPNSAWCFFLYTQVFVSAAAGVHLREMADGSVADLLPNHRKFQLMAASLLLCLCLVLPILFTDHLAFPIPVTLAGFLFFTSLALWIAFSLESKGLIAWVGILVIWWLMVETYRLAGHSPETSRLAPLGSSLGSWWPFFMILPSAAGLLVFAHHYLSARFSHEPKNDYTAALQTQDWVDPVALKTAERAISRLTEKKERTSPVYLLQFSLFSPAYCAGLWYTFAGVFIYAAIVTLLTSRQSSWDFPAMYFYLPFGYYWITAVVAADFLSHRNRMAAVYLQSNLPSRSSFTRTAVLIYLLVIAKQVLGISLAMIILNVFFPWASWPQFLTLCLVGFALSFIQVSLSLLSSSWLATPARSIAWLIVNLFIVVPLMPLAKYHDQIWIVLTALVPLSGLLFLMAIRKWSGTELDFR